MDPWVSADTNITYYKFYQVNIPAKRTSLNVRLVMEGGEPFYLPKGIKIAETFSYFGVFLTGSQSQDGEILSGCLVCSIKG
jgi:hypothetical protein